MQRNSEHFKVAYFFEAVSTRRWFIILPFCMVMIVGFVLAIRLPRIYQAQTMILVQPAKVPESYVRPLISSEIEQRITTISQQIMSRTNLEDIIKQFELFWEPKYEEWFIEDKIENLRERIYVEVIKVGRRDADAFSISFKGEHPEKVMKITNALASYFIHENLMQREALAVGTSDFLKDELKVMRKSLEEHEMKIKDFRKINMGGLPEQLQTNLRILDRLQVQLNEKQTNLRDAKNRLIALNNKISEKPILPQNVYIYPSASESENEVDPELKLEKLKQKHEKMKSKYTDRYPDLKRLKREIKDLESKINQASLNSSDKPVDEISIKQLHPYIREQRKILMQQRAEIELEIENLVSESKNLMNRIAYHQRLVENTPKMEQRLQSIKRDYDNLQNSYYSLLERQMQAGLAVNMEKKQKGEQFRIIDSARLPTKPIEPRMNRLFLLTLMASLGLGCGIAFSLEYFDTSVKRVEDIENDTGYPVIAFMPKIPDAKRKRLQRINFLLTIVSIGFAFLILAAFAITVMKGIEPIMEFSGKVIKLKNIISSFLPDLNATLKLLTIRWGFH